MGAPLKCCAHRGLVCRKLFTNEDPMFLHKIFGLSALFSFLYRYVYIYSTTGTLGFDGSWFDYLTMFIHLTLSASSIIFHVLAQRIYDKPMIIWEEYRLHAIVFTLRCVSVFLYATLVPKYFPTFYDTVYSRVALPTLVLLHHVVVDEITRRHGSKDKNLTTVRSTGTEVIPLWMTMVYRFYSYYQFAALGSHLLPSERLADAGFNTIIAIQSSAFLMTLFRKGLIKNYSHAGWYSFCLILSIFHIFRMNSFSFWYPFKIMIAFQARTKLRINKYYLWISFVVLSIPTIENFIWKRVVDNLASADMHKLQGFSTTEFSMTGLSGLSTKAGLGLETARKTFEGADRTTVLASAAILLLTWYVMISNKKSTTGGLRRSMSNTAVGKYFGFGSGSIKMEEEERKSTARAIKNSMQDLHVLGRTAGEESEKEKKKN